MIATAFSDLNILTVEVDSSMRKFLRAVFSASINGISEYAEVTNGAEALRVLEVFNPDVVVSNWGSGPVNGIDLLRRIQKGSAGEQALLPFIMLSSRDKATCMAEARDAGVSKYLLKPALAHDLFGAIAEVTQECIPFVLSGSYFGPDRRNRYNIYPGTERRVLEAEFILPSDNQSLTPPAVA